MSAHQTLGKIIQHIKFEPEDLGGLGIDVGKVEPLGSEEREELLAEHGKGKAIRLLLLPALVFIFVLGWSFYWIGRQKADKEKRVKRTSPEQKQARGEHRESRAEHFNLNLRLQEG